MSAEMNLEQFVLFKSAEWNRRITWTEISQSTGIGKNTLTRLSNGTCQQIALDTLDKLCNFFDVPDGAPIPFLVFRRKETPHAPSQ